MKVCYIERMFCLISPGTLLMYLGYHDINNTEFKTEKVMMKKKSKQN